MEYYYFHKECLRCALDSEDHQAVDLALDIINCVQHTVQEQRRKQEWRRMKADQAKEALTSLDSDLRELYG
jgi:hypothetical protein